MRGKQAPKRIISGDARFSRVDISKFINRIMERGKKTTAQQIVYGAFDLISEKTKRDALEVYDQALRNVAPSLELKGRRIGGANYQVPVIVMGDRKVVLAQNWLIAAARAKKGKPMAIKLADEIIAASNNEGDAIKKKDDVQKMAEANRAFAHFA
jgi:small subunit ribosomal protein S7